MIRVVVCQLPLGRNSLTLNEKLRILRKGADFVCMPEYFLIPEDSVDYTQLADAYDQNIEYLARLSSDLNTTIIGGTIVLRTSHGMYNTCLVFSRGYRIGSYRKVFPTVREREKGICPGDSFTSWNVDGIRIGVLICADVLHPECFKEMERLNADIVFVPTTSPRKPDETIEDKRSRDQNIFVRGAHSAGSYVVKACATGVVFGNRLQGRSLISAPWKLLWNVPPESEMSSIIQSYDLDMDQLRHYRRKRLIEQYVAELDTGKDSQVPPLAR
jgi:predicted amidohydrolase